MRPPLLTVRDLSVRYALRSRWLRRKTGYFHAVHGVDLDIRSGECLGLVGESGSGKTTVGRSILRVIEPSQGQITLHLPGGGRDVLNASGAELRQLRCSMQMIFQDPFSSLNPRMSTMDNVAEPLLAHGMRNRLKRYAKVEELLLAVGLDPRLGDRFPHAFSGGQRQRIGIARALALEPALLIADEAVSALDVSVQAQILNLLGRLRREKDLSYLFISHDMSVISQMCDRVAVMYLGRIIETGKIADVFARPLHPYTEALLEAIPLPDPEQRGRRKILTGEQGGIPASGCPFAPRCAHAQDACRKAIPPLQEIQPGHFSACFRTGELSLRGVKARPQNAARPRASG